MTTHLQASLGQYSDKGCKQLNQDFHVVSIPDEPQLSSKGIIVALADGISSSEVSQIASEASVTGFVQDYFSTSESWSVKKSAMRVLEATNSWLYSQTRNGPYRYNMDKGYVCTFSALILKSTTAHIFHAGDSRVYRISGNKLEQLTEDHRLWVSREKSYLSRALGMKERIEIDYHHFSFEAGDIFFLATDGVYEFLKEQFIIEIIRANETDLDKAAKVIVEEAIANNSDDNLTVQIIRIDSLPKLEAGEHHQQVSVLPFPPELAPRIEIDGYSIIRSLHNSSRSHVYLALDIETEKQVAIKVPSIDQRDDPAYIERFLMEEWIAKRLDNIHLLKSGHQTRKRNYLYLVTEFIEGQSLNQWIVDNPEPDIETVRDIVGQVATGLQAMHRQEMLHQDLRPNNIMIDKNGTVKIIDFGAVRVAGVAEMTEMGTQHHMLGTAQYMAPEYFLGEPGSTRSDLYSLAVIAYQMLSGSLPYGASVARASTRAEQRNLIYQSMLDDQRTIPVWMDETLRKALHHNPHKRYGELSEFIYDLRHPNANFVRKNRPPLLESNPILFWQGLSLVLFIIIIYLSFK